MCIRQIILIGKYIKELHNQKDGTGLWSELVSSCSQVSAERGAKKDFDKLNLHELERHYLQSYPEAFKFLPPLFLQSLHTIYPLRNKIAHSHFLSPPEVEKLLTSAELIIKYIEKKMNSC